MSDHFGHPTLPAFDLLTDATPHRSGKSANLGQGNPFDPSFPQNALVHSRVLGLPS